MYKKGQLVEGLTFVVFIFIIGVVFLSFSYIFPKISDGLNQTGTFTTVAEQEAIGNVRYMGTSGINQGFLVFFIGLILVQLASVFFIRYHPFFIVIFLVILVANALVAIYLSNAFDQIKNIDEFATTMEEQPVMSFVLDNLLVIAIVTDILMLILLFAKIGEGGATI